MSAHDRASVPVTMEGPFGIGSDLWPGASKLIEECGELVQVLGKLIATGGDTAHWDGSDLGDRLVEEIGDVLAAANFFAWVNRLPQDQISVREHRKRHLFMFWQQEQSGRTRPSEPAQKADSRQAGSGP